MASPRKYPGNSNSSEGPWSGYVGFYWSRLADLAPSSYPDHNTHLQNPLNMTGKACPCGRAQNHRPYAKTSPLHLFQTLSSCCTGTRYLLFISTPSNFYQVSLKTLVQSQTDVVRICDKVPAILCVLPARQSTQTPCPSQTGLSPRRTWNRLSSFQNTDLDTHINGTELRLKK